MNSRAPFIVSLALNAVGAVVIVVLVSQRPAPVPAAAEPPKVVRQTVAVPVVQTNEVVKQVDWRVVESPDYRKYIQNLRSIGCPEETIRDIIIADVDKLFAQRRKELQKPGGEFKFWETGMQSMLGQMADPETLQKQQALAQEKRQLLKDLLGIDVPEKPDMMAAFNPFERLLGFLPEGKQTKVMELMQQMQAKLMKTMGGGAPDEQDRKNMLQAQKDFEKSLAGILDPKEMEDYQLRLSQTSMMMRMELDGFTPSEQEFRDLFKLRKEYDDQFGPFGMMGTSKEEREQQAAAQKALNDNIRNLLGPERYADYEREKDWQFKSLSKVAQRNNVPKESAVAVWDMKKIAEQEASKVRGNSALNSEQKQAALRAIREQTERTVQQTLGESAYKSYSGGNGGHWLRGLSPDVPAPTAPK